MVIMLMGRDGKAVEELVDAHGFLLDALDAWNGPPTARLRQIDPYANVDFGPSELPLLITELGQVRAGVEKRELEKIVRAVERVARRADAEGLRLRFSGD